MWFLNFMLWVIGLMIVGTLVLFGFAIYEEMQPPNIIEGQVIELEHLPESETVSLTPMTISTGNSTMTITQPTYIHSPESFRVVIKNGDKTEDFYVDKKTYEQLKVGNRFRAEGNVKDERTQTTRDATPEEEKKLKED